MGPDVVTFVAGLNYFRTALSAGSPRHETADQSRFLPLGLTMLYDRTTGLTLITLRVICYGEYKFIIICAACNSDEVFRKALLQYESVMLIIAH